MAVYKDLRIKVDPRPTRWSAVQLRPVPLQEGEIQEGVVEAVVEDQDKEAKEVKDPLGLNGTNLVEIQLLYNEGKKLTNAASAADKKGRRKGGKGGGEHTWLADVIQQDKRKKRYADGDDEAGEILEGLSDDDGTEEDEEEDDDTDEEDNSAERDDNQNEEEVRDSILPQDKRFNPTLFLFLLHSGATKQQLEKGLQNLDLVLDKQTKDRENIVRAHLGLFIHCADEIEKLRDAMTNFSYQSQQQYEADQSRYADEEENIQLQQLLQQSELEGGAGGASLSDTLNRAKFYLDIAKTEIQKTLTPTLERIALNRKLRFQEKTLQKLASQNNILDSSTKLREFLKTKDLQRFVDEYLKVQQTDVLSRNELGNVASDSASFDILQQVKDGANKRAEEAIAYCKKMINAPSPGFSDILYYCGIILKLSTADMYYECLEQAYASQLIYFQDEIKIILLSYYSEVDRITGISSDIISFQQTSNELTAKEIYQMSGGRFTISSHNLSSNPLFNPLISVEKVKEMNPFLEAPSTVTAARETTNASIMNGNKKQSKSVPVGNNVDGSAALDDNIDHDIFPPNLVERQLSSSTTRSEQATSRNSRNIVKKFQSRWDAGGVSDISQYDVADGLVQSPMMRSASVKLDDIATTNNVCVEILLDLRLTLVVKLVEKFSKWTPCLIKLVGYLSTLEGLNNSKTSAAARDLASKKSNIKPLMDLITFCSDRLVEALNGVNVSPNKLAAKFKDTISPNMMDGSTNKQVPGNIMAVLQSLISMVESRETTKDSPMSKQLKEPLYSNALEIVTKFYVSMYSFLRTYDSDDFVGDIPAVVKETLKSRERAGLEVVEDSSPRASMRFKAPPSLSQLSDIDPVSKRQKRYKALAGSITTLQVLAKQYFMAHADLLMERLSIFLQEEWASVMSNMSDGNSFSLSATMGGNKRSSGRWRDSNSASVSVSDPSRGHPEQLSELEYTINDSYFLLQRTILDNSLQSQRLDWVLEVVLKGIMKINTQSIMLLMRQVMAHDDGVEVQDMLDSLGKNEGPDFYTGNDDVEEDEDEDEKYRKKLQKVRSQTQPSKETFSDPKLVANDIESIFGAMEISRNTNNPTGFSSPYIGRSTSMMGSMNTQDLNESLTYMFPILRICVLLRNYWFPKIWFVFQSKYYAAAGSLRKSPNLSLSSAPRPNVKAVTARYKFGNMDGGGSIVGKVGGADNIYFEYVSRPLAINSLLRDWIAANVDLLYEPTMTEKLRELVMIEEPLVRKYVLTRLESIRKIISASFTCLIQEEKSLASKSSRRNIFVSSATANSLPSHISRILLLLGNEKSLLTQCLRRTGLFPKDSGKQKTFQSTASSIPPAPTVSPAANASGEGGPKRRGSQVQRRHSSANRADANADPPSLSAAANAAVNSLLSADDGDPNPTTQQDSNALEAGDGNTAAAQGGDSINANDDVMNPFVAFLSDQHDYKHTHATSTSDNFITKTEAPLFYKVHTCKLSEIVL